MKKFKHKLTNKVIKIGDKTGLSCQTMIGNSNLILGDIIKGDDWEEVIEKDYEILSFILRDIIYHVDYTAFANLCSNPKHSNSFSLNFGIQNNYQIHSIKRKSDNAIFTIGDKAITRYGNYGIIVEFENKFNDIYITTCAGKNRCKLKDLKFIKQPFEKDYEILSLTSIESPTRGEKVLWYFDKENNGWTVDEPERAYYKDIPDFTNIHSVKRLSDGEI